MKASKPKVYLDSTCFIDMAKHEAKILDNAGRANDVWHLKKLLEAHRAKEVEVFTSIISVSECVAIEQGQRQVPEETKEYFRRLLISGQYVVLIQPTPFVAERSQNLRWDHEIVLTGADAMHVASALEHGCEEFITTDERIQRAKIQKAIPKLNKLGLRVIHGSETSVLPNSYRQVDLLNGAGDDDASKKSN